MTDNMPTTRKQLCAYINDVLTDLLIEAIEDDFGAERTITIKGNPEFIYNYIENMCSRYNDRNELWYCDVQHIGDSDNYSLHISHNDFHDAYDWQEDDSDEPLVAK